MKSLLVTLAASLLLILAACSDPSSPQTVRIYEMKQYSPDESVSPPPATEAKSEDLLSTRSHANENFNTDDYAPIIENAFLAATSNPLSTFSIDVDEASYSNVRRYLLNGSIPPAGAVRIEEMINYFDYVYPKPEGEIPFTVNTETGVCPWNTRHRLVHIGLRGREIPVENLPPANLVFLVDVSGSMYDANKLPLVKESLKMLTERLREQDNVALVVYAGNAGLVLPSTPGSNKQKIRDAINELEAGGSTAGGEGLLLAYKVARQNFLPEGNNRIILATDGDFNVGPSSDDEMVSLIEEQRKSGVFLSVLGYGMGNYKDNKMQLIADKGNGNHSYIDNISEARKVLVNEFGSTLFTIAKDVKIQVEFNPAKVQAYRLIGYENRMLANEDFNDDTKDAGDLGSGHTVTALYEVIPAGVESDFTKQLDNLKYQSPRAITGTQSDEMMTIQLRYKEPRGNKSSLITEVVKDGHLTIENTSDNYRFSAAVAGFGLLLRNSAYKQSASFEQVIRLARSAKGQDVNGYRSEFIQLVEMAGLITKN